MIEKPIEWLGGAEKPSYCDKMMSNQSFFKSYYVKDDLSFHYDLYSLIHDLSDLKVFDEIKIENTPMFTIAEMGTPPMVLAFMQFLIRIVRPKRILEIGTFIGHSAIALGKAMPGVGCELLTLEKFDHFAAIARKNIEANGLQDRVKVIEGDAFASLSAMDPDVTFDMVFIDGNKERYGEYVKMIEPRMAAGGMLIVDDVLMLGDVLNIPPQCEKGAGVAAMIDYLKDNDAWEKIMLPISDGFLIARKL